MNTNESSLLQYYIKFFLLIGAIGGVLFSSIALAASAGGGQLIQIPVRWCAMQGSTAVSNPAALGEPDTDNVLWRRHERPSDRILIPGSNLTLRSAFTSDVLSTATFPTINDPNPPAAGGAGSLGDIVDPQISTVEHDQALASCRTAWNSIATSSGAPVRGPVAVNINRFVDFAGNPTSLWGWGGFTSFTVPGGASTCNPTSVLSAQGGTMVMVDFSVTGTAENDALLVGHEFGHVMTLAHGNGIDDDGDGRFDEWCDPDEMGQNTPATFMHPNIPSATRRIEISQSQVNAAVGRANAGAQIDPPMQLVNGDIVSDERSDPLDDVSSTSVDMKWISVVKNPEQKTVVVSHAMVGQVLEETNTLFL